MQPIHLLSLALLAVSQVVSLPTANPQDSVVAPDECGIEDGSVVKRAKCQTPVTCGPEGQQTTFTNSFVNNVVKRAKSRISKGEKDDTYPKPYGVNDIAVSNALPDDCKPIGDFKFYEYPILNTGYYMGGDPLADRVIIAEKNGARTYCLTVTHRGATDNSFVPCVAF